MQFISSVSPNSLHFDTCSTVDCSSEVNLLAIFKGSPIKKEYFVLTIYLYMTIISKQTSKNWQKF